MTKKFISILISVIMVTSLITSINVSAESAFSQHFSEDFETWVSGTKFNENYTYSSTTTSISSDGTYGGNSTKTRFSLGKFLFAEVVTMPGYDGKTTNAIKLTAKSDGSSTGWKSGNTPGGGRFIYTNAATLPTTGVYVQEFNIYHSENDIYKFLFGKVGIVNGSIVDASGINQVSDYSTVKKLNLGWNKITVVSDLDSRKVILYHNDELVSYNKRDHSGDSSFGASATIQVGTYKVTDWKDKSLIFDDFNIYSNPDVIGASSEFAGSDTVAATASITVDFTDKILETVVGGVSTVSAANVEMTKSNGETVGISAVTVGDDEKSLKVDTVSDMDKGETYTVKVTGVIDRYGRVIEDYTFSFTTADDNLIEVKETPKFVKQYLFQPGNTGVNLRALENGYISASHTVRNNSAKRTQEAIIVCVLKENGEIKYFQFKTGTLAPDEELTFNGGFKVDNAAEQSIEIYVWDTMSGMTPLAEKYTINSTGIFPAVSE